MKRLDYFPALDGLRAVGATGVLLTHVAFQTGQYPQGVTGALLARLDVGVALFFVLSGFLMALGFLRPMAEGRTRPSYVAYAVKRFFRIWPVFAVTVVAATALIGRDTTAGSWVGSLTLTHLYSKRFFTDGLTQMWSLETEVAFYVVLPFLMSGLGLMVGRGTWSVTRILACLAMLVALNWIWLGDIAGHVAEHRPFAQQWLPSYLGWFALGIAMAVLWVDATRSGATKHAAPHLVNRLAASPGALGALAFSALLIASTPLAGPLNLTAATQSAALVKNVLYGIVAVLVVLPAVFGPEGDRYHRVLSWPPVRYLGHLSYAIFCIHLVMLWYVQKMLGNSVFTGNFLEVAGLTIVFTVMAAMVLHHVVERPAMRFSRRLLAGKNAPAKAAASAPSASS
jgi:peptidoglycan/LPS O-acetylase OafA/YrhL